VLRVPGSVYLPTRGFCRTLGISTGNTGGDLVGGNLQRVADAARPPLLLEQLGAVRLEVSETGAISLPVWSAGAGSGWVAEDAPAAQLQSTVRSVEASGRMAAARLSVSRRLQLQADAVEEAVLRELRAAVADTIESGFLAGSGAESQPLGLIRTPGAATVAWGAAVPSYAELMDMLAAFAGADGDLDNAAILMHPTTLTGAMEAEISAGSGTTAISWSDGAYRFAGVRCYPTRNLPTGKALLFDPATIRTVYWGAPQLVVDRVSNGKSLSGAADLIVFNLCDIAALHPGQIVVGSS
jgi:HK97 family phage major capsid protein